MDAIVAICKNKELAETYIKQTTYHGLGCYIEEHELL